MIGREVSITILAASPLNSGVYFLCRSDIHPGPDLIGSGVRNLGAPHFVQPLGVAALGRWGLLERLVATGCPPIDTYSLDFGPFTISGLPATDDSPVAYAPRRTLLDAAAEVGAQVRGRVHCLRRRC